MSLQHTRSPADTARMGGPTQPRVRAHQQILRTAAMAAAVPAAIVAVGVVGWWLRVTGREAVRA